MSNRLLIWMTALVLLGMGILFALNMTSILSGHMGPQAYLKSNNVRGIAIQHHEKLYTLNFTQQNKVIQFLNQSDPIEKIGDGKRQDPNFKSLIIYQFEGDKEIILTPITYLNNNLVYQVKEWNPNGYLMEVSEGQLKQLLSQTYDP